MAGKQKSLTSIRHRSLTCFCAVVIGLLVILCVHFSFVENLWYAFSRMHAPIPDTTLIEVSLDVSGSKIKLQTKDIADSSSSKQLENVGNAGSKNQKVKSFSEVKRPKFEKEKKEFSFSIANKQSKN